MILSGQTIRDYGTAGMINPFREKYQKHGLSGGLGTASYDLAVEFDPEGKVADRVLKIGDFLLASTVEYVTLPPEILGIVHDKSTWARQGLAVQNTLIDPGFRGHITLEITNHGPDDLWLFRSMPIAQIVFHFLDVPVLKIYDGKYQGQPRGPVAPR